MTPDRMPEGGFARLVPELDVRDLDASLAFWCAGLGFGIAYARHESAFAYLERDGAQVMLNTLTGNWTTGPLVRPFGRGINFQIEVRSIAPILASLEAMRWPLFRPPHDALYRIGQRRKGCRQFLVQDPDGYLLRFSQDLGLEELAAEKSATGDAGGPNPVSPDAQAS